MPTAILPPLGLSVISLALLSLWRPCIYNAYSGPALFPNAISEYSCRIRNADDDPYVSDAEVNDVPLFIITDPVIVNAGLMNPEAGDVPPVIDTDPDDTIPLSKCTFGDAMLGIRNAVVLAAAVKVAPVLIVNESLAPLAPAEKLTVLVLKFIYASCELFDVSILSVLVALPDNVKSLLINLADSAESVESVITVTVPCFANVYRSPFVNAIFAISYFVYLFARAVLVFMLLLSNGTYGSSGSCFYVAIIKCYVILTDYNFYLWH